MRTHPLDPLGENFENEGRLALFVTNFYLPRSGLAEISVNLSPGTITGQTDGEGRFVSSLEEGMYEVLIEKDGYATIDTLIEITAGEVVNMEVALPGLPVFNDFEINSLHVSRWFPPPTELFSIQVDAMLDDQDGVADIDSLWVLIDSFNFREAVLVQSEPGRFVHSISSNGLAVSLNALLGHDIRLKAKDRSGTVSFSDTKSLVRVINDTPLAGEPDELQNVPDPQPLFTWQPIILDFPYTYRVDIVQVNDNIQSTVQTIQNISSSDTSVVASAPLSTGEYFWTVSVVDEFGNRSRSREAGFRVP